MGNLELNLAILIGVIYTVLGYISYNAELYIITTISLLIAFVFTALSVILDT